jgi:hypothetical protein
MKMIRRAAIVALVLTLHPAWLRAQDAVFTISVPSADVYKGPSTATPVIGHVSRGTALPVTRNLGSWVRVPWPDGLDGAGYVHVSKGHLDQGTAGPTARSSSGPGPTADAPQTRASAGTQFVPGRPAHATRINHALGVGGLVGSPASIGVSTRAWSRNRLGFQFGIRRDVITSDVAAGRVTSVQFEPGVIYALPDHVSDYVWIRPYIGSLVTFDRQTLNAVEPAVAPPVSDTGVGFRVFGGTELTFASVPRLALSVDVGYRRAPAPFPGFDPPPLSVSIAGHWYVR